MKCHSLIILNQLARSPRAVRISVTVTEAFVLRPRRPGVNHRVRVRDMYPGARKAVNRIKHSTLLTTDHAHSDVDLAVILGVHGRIQKAWLGQQVAG